jgi:hypothetical protein
MTHSPRGRADMSNGGRTALGRPEIGGTTGGGAEANGAKSGPRGASAAAMVETSSASRGLNHGASEADVGAELGIGARLAALEPRDAMRRSAAFAVSKA